MRFATRAFRARISTIKYQKRPLLTLAIETSCDDTCVAVLEKSGPAARLLFNKKITSDNSAFGGIHPKVAVLGHATNLAGLVNEAVQTFPNDPDGEIGKKKNPDFVTVTRGPGMPTNLSIGLCTAKGLAVAWQVPLLGVHHMQAHALTPRLVHALSVLESSTPGSSQPETKPEYPFLTLLVSGGHTQLVLSRSLTEHTILASTESLPLGNMLDGSARYILPREVLDGSGSVMYGALLEEFAFPSSSSPSSPSSTSPDHKDINYHDIPEDTHDTNHDEYNYTPPPTRRHEIQPFSSHHGWTLTVPLSDRKTMAYSFTGLNSQVQRIIEDRTHKNNATGMLPSERRLLAQATMKIAFEHLASRVIFALDSLRSQSLREDTSEVKTLVISGGVASNQFLRHVLRRILDVRGYEGVEIVAPPVELCTDNAAMIAWTGVEMWEAGWRSGLDITVHKKWSVDSAGEDGGILGGGVNFVRRDS